MRYEEIKVGQRVYDPKLQENYIWVAGQFVYSDGELHDHLCNNCGYPDKFFLKYNDSSNTIFCTDCAGIDTLQVVMVAVK